jgi:DNA-binding MarR family transcriptional regulator
MNEEFGTLEMNSYLRKVVYTLDRIVDRVLRENVGITLSQFLVLRSLDKTVEHTISQQAIADYLGIHKAAVSRHVNLLVRRGLISRQNHITSRREYDLQLTPTGLAILTEARLVTAQALAPHYQHVGPKLLESLQTLYASFETERLPKPSAGE